MPNAPLPTPDAEAQRTSEALTSRIRAAIRAAGGAIAFDEYMRMALYEPGLGYYSAGMPRFGARGDYTTAALMTPLFGRTLARQAAVILDELGGDADVLELGAGTGDMAADCLLELAAVDALPRHYYVLEVSAALRQEQARTLERRCPELAARVTWLDGLPQTPMRGVILANEVLDALPVKRFRIDPKGLREIAITADQQGLQWTQCAPEPALCSAIVGIEAELGTPLAEGTISEWCPTLAPWLASVADALEAGVALFLDYGYRRGELYQADRLKGTLMCHYRHRAHDDALFRPGLQDITASVDFTAAARAGSEAGLRVLGYAPQGPFLMSAGLAGLLEQAMADDPNAGAALSQAAKPLILPGDMGERFKVLAFGRGVEGPLSGFDVVNHEERL